MKEVVEASLMRREGWSSMESAPKDGTKFWGLVGSDVVAMFWHPEFKEFVSGFNRMTLARGYTYDDGSTFHDHSPEVRRPVAWSPLPDFLSEAQASPTLEDMGDE